MKPFDLPLFLEIHAHMRGRVRYQWGAKAAHPTEDTSRIDVLDCSGYVQYQFARQGIEIPAGSVEIAEWMKRHAKLLTQPSNDLAIHAWPPSAHRPGHIYFSLYGRTFECSSSLGGVADHPLPRYTNHPEALSWMIET